MARYRRKRNEGFGVVIVAMGLLLFVLFLGLIPALPFEITVVEQSLMYLFAFLIMVGGLVLLIK